MGASRIARVLAGEERSLLAFVWRGLLAWPGWLAYWLGLRMRDGLFLLRLKRVHRVPVPVISVGNLSAGGTGKTPAVVMIARALEGAVLASQGRRLAVLSRGYRPLPGEQGNDEARLLAELLPQTKHHAEADRVAGARALCAGEERLGCILLDDGFSHRRLGRSVEVVLIDATRPLTVFELLPRGLLREAPAALKRADVVIVTRSDLVEPATLSRLLVRIRRRLRAAVPIATAVHAPRKLEPVWPAAASYTSAAAREPYELAGKRVLLLAGIGNPEAFAATLRGLGAHLERTEVWPDHHPFTQQELAAVHARATAAGVRYVVTTRKDAVRLATLPPPAEGPMWRYLDVQLALTDGAELFWSHLLERLRSESQGAT